MVANLWGPLPTDGQAESPAPVAAYQRHAPARRTETTSRLATRPSPRRDSTWKYAFWRYAPKSMENEQSEAARLARLNLRSQVDSTFARPTEATVIGCDVLRGKTSATTSVVHDRFRRRRSAPRTRRLVAVINWPEWSWSRHMPSGPCHRLGARAAAHLGPDRLQVARRSQPAGRHRPCAAISHSQMPGPARRSPRHAMQWQRD